MVANLFELVRAHRSIPTAPHAQPHDEGVDDEGTKNFPDTPLILSTIRRQPAVVSFPQKEIPTTSTSYYFLNTTLPGRPIKGKSMSTISLRWQLYFSFIAVLLATVSLSDCTVLAFSTTGSGTFASSCSSSSSSSSNMKDANMKQTYDDLAKRALDAYRDQCGSGHNGSLWIACVGGPGAGKTTTAAAVVERLCAMTNDDNCAVAVPMDGYHYTKADLRKRSRPDDESRGMNRRGAPWTFDAQNLAVDLAEAKKERQGQPG